MANITSMTENLKKYRIKKHIYSNVRTGEKKIYIPLLESCFNELPNGDYTELYNKIIQETENSNKKCITINGKLMIEENYFNEII